MLICVGLAWVGALHYGRARVVVVRRTLARATGVGRGARGLRSVGACGALASVGGCAA
jgi:hypothetical protein